MAEQLYGLTSRSADRLRQIFADGGSVGSNATRVSAASGGTWVKVTGAALSGWHTGVVSLDTTGTWEDLTNVVLVGAADGSSLVIGNRYLCTRTGDKGNNDEQDTARFRTVKSGGGSGDVVGPASATDTALSLYDGTTGKLIKNSRWCANSSSIKYDTNFSGGFPMAELGVGFGGAYLSLRNDYLGNPTTTTLSCGQYPALVMTAPGAGPVSIQAIGNEIYAYTIESGAFVLTASFVAGGLTHNPRYAVVQYQPGGGPSVRYDGINTFFQVTQSGVTKTVNVVGGIIVGIS